MTRMVHTPLLVDQLNQVITVLRFDDLGNLSRYRAMVNIIEFIKMMDEVVPGFASPETLLYSPELKFYSNKVKMDTDLETNIEGLHCLGDSSGWTRGLMMASVMGVLMGRKLMEKHSF